MAENFRKTSYVAGTATVKALDPTGDNVVANFARGAAMYFDADVAAKRNAAIESDKADYKAWLLAKS